MNLLYSLRQRDSEREKSALSLTSRPGPEIAMIRPEEGGRAGSSMSGDHKKSFLAREAVHQPKSESCGVIFLHLTIIVFKDVSELTQLL